MMIPAPAAGLLWALVDVALAHYSVLHPIYYLTEASLLMAANVALGVVTIMLYSYVLFPPPSCKKPFTLQGMD